MCIVRIFKENETCLISITKPKQNQLIDIEEEEEDENEHCQRFTIFATIADIFRENQINIDHQHLVCTKDFAPSRDTQLVTLSSESPVQLTLIDDCLPVTVTVLNNEDQNSILFHCSTSMTVKQLLTIAVARVASSQ